MLAFGGGPIQALFITPDNVNTYADHISPTATITAMAISFDQGTRREDLLTVGLGSYTSDVTIRITIGLDDTAASTPGTDHDLQVGITDGTIDNLFTIHDIGNYEDQAPCRPSTAGTAEQEDNRVDERAHAPAQGTLTFKPTQMYGSCYLPLDGGYMNVAIYNDQVDASAGVSLLLRRGNAREEYRIYNILVEIIENN